MYQVKVIFPGPEHPEIVKYRNVNLEQYQPPGVKFSYSYNEIGPLHCQTLIEDSLGRAGMAQQAAKAEKEGMDAIIIESMGDTGLLECREAVQIPVIGMCDLGSRIAGMLGRRYGMVVVGRFHGITIERVIKSYDQDTRYGGFEALDLQPFFTDSENEELLAEIFTLAKVKPKQP